MQPMHMVLDLGDKAKDDAVGPERAKRSWRLRDLLDAGANVTLGTDFPIVEIDPLHEVYGAVTRQLFDGTPEEGWFPEQRISLAEALRAYTLNSAIAEGVEDQFGMLKEGLSADLIVLDRNLFAVDPKEILEAKVVLTMLRGGVVYEDAEPLTCVTLCKPLGFTVNPFVFLRGWTRGKNIVFTLARGRRPCE